MGISFSFLLSFIVIASVAVVALITSTNPAILQPNEVIKAIMKTLSVHGRHDHNTCTPTIPSRNGGLDDKKHVIFTGIGAVDSFC